MTLSWCTRFGRGSLLLFGLMWASRNPSVEAANVLLSGWFGVGSHFYSMVEIGKSLVRRGHDVTFLISDEYPEHSTEDEYTGVFTFDMFHCQESLRPKVNTILAQTSEAILGTNNFRAVSRIFAMFRELSDDACKCVMKDEALLDRLDKYDVFVTDAAWLCSIYVQSYLERHRGADIRAVVLAPASPSPFIFHEAGNPFMLSYQPSFMTQLTSSMTFFERIHNVATYLSATVAVSSNMMTGPYAELVDQYDLDPDLKITISNQVGLFLMNFDFSTEFPFVVMPNVIPVGGLTSKPAQALNKDLEEFMQSSGDAGVIVFSLGSYLSVMTETRPDLVSMFLDAFSRVPQMVVMHLRKLPARTIPRNIKILPWLPLNDLLGHPKTCAVLYHGGNNGFYEAVYHGVPLVVMPLHNDQYSVAARVVAKGLGTSIDKDRLSADYIYRQLTEVIENLTYASTAKRLSAIFRDRPMTGPDTGAFWIEHVLKHGGDHLRPSTLDMSFFQIYLIDVGVFFSAITGIALYLVSCVVGRCCFPQRSPKKKKE